MLLLCICLIVFLINGEMCFNFKYSLNLIFVYVLFNVEISVLVWLFVVFVNGDKLFINLYLFFKF